MIAKIIKIGNSRGIRIPGHILKDMHMESQVELIVNNEEDEIILKAIRNSREGWDSAFKKMSSCNDDKLLIDDTLDTDENWEW